MNISRTLMGLQSISYKGFLLAVGITTFGNTALAESFPGAVLKKDSLICYSRSDWKDVLMEYQDENPDGVRPYLKSGKCRTIKTDTRVEKLGDGPLGSDELISLPSGKTAFTLKAFLK